MNELEFLKENGINLDEKNPFETEKAETENMYTYDELKEMFGDDDE